MSTSQSNILSIVTTAVQENNYLSNSSVIYKQISGEDMCGNVVDNDGNYVFEWVLKLNRYILENQ